MGMDGMGQKHHGASLPQHLDLISEIRTFLIIFHTLVLLSNSGHMLC
jgi:hypothetical protein